MKDSGIDIDMVRSRLRSDDRFVCQNRKQWCLTARHPITKGGPLGDFLPLSSSPLRSYHMLPSDSATQDRAVPFEQVDTILFDPMSAADLDLFTDFDSYHSTPINSQSPSHHFPLVDSGYSAMTATEFSDKLLGYADYGQLGIIDRFDSRSDDEFADASSLSQLQSVEANSVNVQ